MKKIPKKERRLRRKKRVRAKIFGTLKRPRLCVFRSNKHIYCQLIDDEKGRTLVSVNDLKIKGKTKKAKPHTPPPPSRQGGPLGKTTTKNLKVKKENTARTSKIAVAYEVGKLIAKKAKDLKIEKVVFDRGGYKYQGRVKALAEGAREGGLKF